MGQSPKNKNSLDSYHHVLYMKMDSAYHSTESNKLLTLQKWGPRCKVGMEEQMPSKKELSKDEARVLRQWKSIHVSPKTQKFIKIASNPHEF